MLKKLLFFMSCFLLNLACIKNVGAQMPEKRLNM